MGASIVDFSAEHAVHSQFGVARPQVVAVPAERSARVYRLHEVLARIVPAGGPAVDAGPGDVLLVNWGVPHRLVVRPHEAGRPGQVLVVENTEHRSAQVRAAPAVRLVAASTAADGSLLRLVDAALDELGPPVEHPDAPAPVPPVAAALLETVAVAALPRGVERAAPELLAVAEMVHERPHLPWSVPALARAAGLGRTAFVERFRVVFGEPPMSYVTAVRLERARTALDRTPAGLAGVASATGYRSPAALSRAYRHRFGVPPTRSRTVVGDLAPVGAGFTLAAVPAAHPLGGRDVTEGRVYAVDGEPLVLWVAGTATAIEPGAVVVVTWGTPHGLATTAAAAAAAARRPAGPLPGPMQGGTSTLVARLPAFRTHLARVLPPVLWLTAEHPRTATARALLETLGRGGDPEDVEVRRWASRALVAVLTRTALDQGLGPATGPVDALADPGIGPVLAAVHAEPGAHWTVRRLAAIAGISAAHLSDRFPVVTGTTVMAYVALVRARVAEHALRESDLPLAEIARLLGYDSHPTFHRAFTRVVGRTPGAVRRSSATSAARPDSMRYRWVLGDRRDGGSADCARC